MTAIDLATRYRAELVELRQRLADHAIDLCIELFGATSTQTKRELRWGRKGSRVLRLSGRNGPSWYDYEASAGGSMLDAIMAAIGCSFPDAVRWARDWLGDDQVPQSSRPARQRPTPVDVDVENAEKQRQAAALWASGRPVEGTLAGLYLRDHRGIAPDTWPASTVRYATAGDVKRHVTHWTWWRWPALLLAASDAAGAVTGLQLIALQPDGRAALHWDGSGKKLKMSYGRLRDAAVRWAGDGDGPLLLAEGGETAASCWWATGCETWANLGSIARAPLDDVPLTRPIIVCADDDPRNAPANKALNDAINKMRRLAGRRVLKAKPWRLTRGDKSDFNDLLLAEGREAVRASIMKGMTPPTSTPRVGVDQAREKMTRIIGKAVDDLLAWRPMLAGQVAPFKVVRVGLGIGKSEAAIERAVEAAARGVKVVYLVSDHKLGGEIAGRLDGAIRRLGADIEVATWRGRGAEQPDDPELPMCAELPTVEKAQKAGIDVAETICPICPRAETCPYLEQGTRDANVWVAAHDVLFNAPPGPMEDAGQLVVDEGIGRGLIGLDKPLTLTVEDITRAPVLSLPAATVDLAAELMPLRRKFAAALRDHPAGGLDRQRLLDAGLTADDAKQARTMEWEGRLDPKISDNTTWLGVTRAVAQAAAHNKPVGPLLMLWHEAEALLLGDGTARAGRAVWDGEALRLTGLAAIKAAWQEIPALAIDATVDMTLLRHRVPHAELIADIEAAAPSMRVTQYTGPTFGKGALVEVEKVEGGEDVERPTRRLLRAYDWAVSRASRAGGHWLVVLPKIAEEAIGRERPKLPFIATEHFGKVRGVDLHKAGRGVIVIGRPMPRPEDVERLAGTLTGRWVNPLAGDWYPAEQVAIHGSDGTVATVEADRHPDPVAEAVRASICEAELLQAIGRARGVNRTAADPVDVILLGNVAAPGLVVDAIRQWAGPTIDDEILAQHGAVPECAADAAQVAGRPVEAIKKARQRMGTFPYKDLLYENVPNLRSAIYLRAGPGRSRRRVTYEARRITDVQAWLTQRLGPLAFFKASQQPPANSACLAPEVPAMGSAALPAGASYSANSPRPVIRPPVEAECPTVALPAVAMAYRHGTLPVELRAWSRDRRRAACISQQEVARRIGVSRPQLANVEAGRFGLSPAAAARFLATVAGLAIRQGVML